jgi:short-subunit dehydrogenase
MNQKLAVVTGASSGIGWELARQLAQRGYNLLLVARRTERLEALAKEIVSTTRSAVDVLALDLTRPDERKKLSSRLESAGSGLALVVNNAGVGFVGPTWACPLERVIGIVELNISALTEISFEAARIMSRNRAGGLINVASTAAFQSVPYMNVYSATKGYVLSFTEALAEELSGYGVRVMALCPGYTESEFHAIAGVKEDALRKRIAMTAEKCARLGLQDFERGRRISITGWGNKLQVFGSWLAPRALVTRAASRMMRQRSGQ